jgi:hypothetical protein
LRSSLETELFKLSAARCVPDLLEL